MRLASRSSHTRECITRQCLFQGSCCLQMLTGCHGVSLSLLGPLQHGLRFCLTWSSLQPLDLLEYSQISVLIASTAGSDTDSSARRLLATQQAYAFGCCGGMMSGLPDASDNAHLACPTGYGCRRNSKNYWQCFPGAAVVQPYTAPVPSPPSPLIGVSVGCHWGTYRASLWYIWGTSGRLHTAEGYTGALQRSTAQAAQCQSKLGDNVAGRATVLLMLSVKMLSGESYPSRHPSRLFCSKMVLSFCDCLSTLDQCSLHQEYSRLTAAGVSR